jgi:hypothetical protein
VHKLNPREVLEVTRRARPNEAYRYGHAFHTAFALVVATTVAPRGIAELPPVNKAAATLADEPRGKLEDANALGEARIAIVAMRRAPEIVVSVEVEFVELCEAVPQARLFNGIDAGGGVPGIETADDDCMLKQVDHRTRAVRTHEVRLSNLAVGLSFRPPGLSRATEARH